VEDFNSMAENFDTKRRMDRAKIIADKIQTHVVDGHKKSAIEYGCGTGLVGLQLGNIFHKLLLVDSSVEMIKQVEQKLATAKIHTVSALCLDFMDDIPKGVQADYIFSSLVIHHIMDTEEVFRRLHSILKDDGHFLMVDLDKEDGSFHAKYPDFDGHNGFEHSALTAIATKAGFSNIEIETFYHDTKTFIRKESPYSLFILDATK